MTVRDVTPVPETVNVADLLLVPVFAELAVTVMVPLLAPEVCEQLSQLGIPEIFQLVLEVILNVPVDPDSDPRDILVGDTSRFNVPPPLAYVQYTEYL